jgi:hypothetical protein
VSMSSSFKTCSPERRSAETTDPRSAAPRAGARDSRARPFVGLDDGTVGPIYRRHDEIEPGDRDVQRPRRGYGRPPNLHAMRAEMRIVAFMTEATAVQRILSHSGEPATPPRIAPVRGPPSWEEDDSEASFLHEERVPGDPLALPEPDYGFDPHRYQSISLFCVTP